MTAKALRVVLRLSRAEARGAVRPSEERVGGLGRSRPMRERERVSLRREGIVVPFPERRGWLVSIIGVCGGGGGLRTGEIGMAFSDVSGSVCGEVAFAYC